MNASHRLFYKSLIHRCILCFVLIRRAKANDGVEHELHRNELFQVCAIKRRLKLLKAGESAGRELTDEFKQLFGDIKENHNNQL